MVIEQTNQVIGSALEEVVTQVPKADRYGLDLIKDKVDLLSSLMTPIMSTVSESVCRKLLETEV